MMPALRPTRLARRMLADEQHGWLVKDAETGTTIGWVVRRTLPQYHHDMWRAFVVRSHNLGGQGLEVGQFDTRRDAIVEVEIRREV
jgi:hypothetical protein